MTVVGWIIFIIISCFIFGCATTIAMFNDTKTGWIASIIVSIVITFILLFGMLWWFNNTEQGKRAFKTQESNFGDGIERVVRVYDVNGELIETYDGKFDITYDDDRVLFDDENGKRHIIYYPTGTVLIDEK